MQECFPNHLQMHIFFTSGKALDTLINGLEEGIIVLIWAAFVFSFNCYLNQKQRFSVWSFTENTSFISFHGEICSRYS